ncbi:hypothetical protein YC2023_109221 [Brassica napus]
MVGLIYNSRTKIRHCRLLFCEDHVTTDLTKHPQRMSMLPWVRAGPVSRPTITEEEGVVSGVKAGRPSIERCDTGAGVGHATPPEPSMPGRECENQRLSVAVKHLFPTDGGTKKPHRRSEIVFQKSFLERGRRNFLSPKINLLN